MFGLTQVTALSLLALRVLAQETSIAPDATSAVASAMPSSSAAPAATSSVAEDGSDGNDVPASGGNPGWNTTYFLAPSNSKLHGFWVNGLENKAYWKPVNITSRLVLTNSNKELWAGEQELATNIAGGVSEWSGPLKEPVPEGHNYLLSLYDGTSGSKLGQTSGFTMRMNGTLAPNPPPEVAAGQNNGASSSQGEAAQTSGGNAEATSSGAAAGESSAAAPSASAGANSGAGRNAVSGAVAVVAVAAYRVYEVPTPVHQVRDVRVVPVQQVQQVTPQRQLHTVRSVPQFAHPNSQQLVRPLGFPNGPSSAVAPNGHAPAGPSFAGYPATPNAGRLNGAPGPAIPNRRSSHPQATQSNGALNPTSPPTQNGATTSPDAAQFPPPILRTARKPTEPVSFPPPPRHKAAHGSSATATAPRTPPSVIDLTQDTSPSSAGSPPKQRAQSDVGRPSRSAPRSNGSAVGSVLAGSVVSGPSSAPSRSVVSAPTATSTPRRKAPASSTPTGTGASVTSPTPSPSKVRCAGFTRTGQRCKRHVKTAAPGVTLLEDPDSGRYCKDHAGLLLKPAGFYWRTAAGGSGTWVEFKSFIPRALGEQTQALLRTTMESALSNKEAPGFLYVYELRGMGGASTTFFKVGRSDNVPRRIGQWTNQCASHAPVLRDVFPLSDKSPSNLPGAMERDVSRMTAASKRWERLVHLELADRAASERPLAYKSLEAPCADCGAVHREIFPLASSEGYEAVVEVISRWEGFIRAISAPVGTPSKSRG